MSDLILLTVKEAAELLKRHPGTIYRRLEAGEWNDFAWKEGKNWRIEKAGLLEHLRSRPIHTRAAVADDPMPRPRINRAASKARFRELMAQGRKQTR